MQFFQIKNQSKVNKIEYWQRRETYLVTFLNRTNWWDNIYEAMKIFLQFFKQNCDRHK